MGVRYVDRRHCLKIWIKQQQRMRTTGASVRAPRGAPDAADYTDDVKIGKVR